MNGWIDAEDLDAEIVKEHPALMAEIKRVLPKLTSRERLIVATLVRETCPYCAAAGRDCNCMRDE